MGRPGQAGAWRLPVADRRTVRRAAWQLIRADRTAMVIVLGLNGFAALAGLAGPWLLGEIVNQVESGAATVSTIDRLALGVVAFAFAQLLLTRFARYAAHRFGERALARLREQLVDNALALPTHVVEKAGSGDLMTRSSGDVTTVGTTLRDAAPEVFTSGMHVLFVFGAVFALDPLLGLSALAGIPVMWWVTRWYLRQARDAYLAEGQAGSDVAESVAATTDGARTVEAFRLRQSRISDADDAIDTVYRTKVRTLFLRSVLFPVTEFAHSLPLALVLLVGGTAYLDGSVSLGAVVASGVYMSQLVDPLDRILMWMEQLQRSGSSLARIKGIESVTADTTPAAGTPADDRVEVRDARFAYSDGRDVLHGISLAVQPGERLAIVGPSGAGKSTLARLMAGVDAPRTGSVLLGGVPAAQLAAEDLRRHVVLVTQDHHVFIGTLRENVAMAVPSADDDAIHTALATVGADWVEALPDGLDTQLGSGATRLDPAQAQQLSLARVVLLSPHTLILDEATAALDPSTARQAERSVAAVLTGRTVIAIAHRLHTAHDADRVAVVESGRITELGSHHELLGANGAYAALWRSWQAAATAHD